MSNVNLHNYADGGRLVDADIVSFLRKKLDKERRERGSARAGSGQQKRQ